MVPPAITENTYVNLCPNPVKGITTKKKPMIACSLFIFIPFEIGSAYRRPNILFNNRQWLFSCLFCTKPKRFRSICEFKLIIMILLYFNM